MSFVTLLLVFAVGGTVDVGGGIVGWLLERLVSITGGSGPLLGAAIVTTIALKAALATANEVFSATARYEIYHRLRLDIFSAYLALPYDRFSISDRGVLFNTLEAETWNVSEAVQCVFRIAVNVAPTLVFGALILAVDWKVGLGVGIAGSAALGLVSLARGPSRILSRSAQTQNEALADQAYTAIGGMRTICILGQEARTRQLFADSSQKSGQIFRKSGTRRRGRRSPHGGFLPHHHWRRAVDRCLAIVAQRYPRFDHRTSVPPAALCNAAASRCRTFIQLRECACYGIRGFAGTAGEAQCRRIGALQDGRAPIGGRHLPTSRRR